MGTYPVNCPECGKSHLWFSGSMDQRCDTCRAAKSPYPDSGMEALIRWVSITGDESAEYAVRQTVENVKFLQKELLQLRTDYAKLQNVANTWCKSSVEHGRKADDLAEELRVARVRVSALEGLFKHQRGLLAQTDILIRSAYKENIALYKAAELAYKYLTYLESLDSTESAEKHGLLEALKGCREYKLNDNF